jgi:hypothetical protein
MESRTNTMTTDQGVASDAEEYRAIPEKAVPRPFPVSRADELFVRRNK